MTRFVALFRDANFWTAARARLGVKIVAGFVGLFWIAAWRVELAHGGLPIAKDFDAFWAAAHLAVGGHPATAYSNVAIEAFERLYTDMPPGYLAFYYPPSFLLLCLPLGFLAYTPALWGFISLQFCLLTACLRRILTPGWAWWPIAVLPAFTMNAISGQNGGLTAACFAGGLIWLERRPILAGICLGLLACKPQLAPCVPVALVFARRWRALAAAGVTAVSLAAVSLVVLGPGAWLGFLQNSAFARRDLETLPIKWPLMQSPYAAARLFGGGVALGYAVQAVAAVFAIGLLIWVVSRRPGAGPEMATLTTAALLVSPFLYDYDLTCLAVPMAWITNSAIQGGWAPWEKTCLTILYVLPFAARAAGLGLGLTLAPPLIIALLFLLKRRAEAVA